MWCADQVSVIDKMIWLNGSVYPCQWLPQFTSTFFDITLYWSKDFFSFTLWRNIIIFTWPCYGTRFYFITCLSSCSRGLHIRLFSQFSSISLLCVPFPETQKCGFFPEAPSKAYPWEKNYIPSRILYSTTRLLIWQYKSLYLRQCCGSGIRDPVLFYPLDPGWVIFDCKDFFLKP
jgi:hypothetical protein